MLKLNSGALEHSFYQLLIPQAASYVTRKNTNSPALSGGDSTVELKGKEGKEGKGKEGWREGGEEGGRGGEKGREWVLHKGEMCSGLWQVSVVVCTLCLRHDANAGTASRHWEKPLLSLVSSSTSGSDGAGRKWPHCVLPSNSFNTQAIDLPLCPSLSIRALYCTG